MKLDPLTDPYLFYCILLYSTVFYCSLLYSIGFYAILLYSIIFYIISAYHCNHNKLFTANIFLIKGFTIPSGTAIH